MTALGRYAKLEAEARYFDGHSARPREVVISFGERSLMIVGLDDQAIAHWPLASLRALDVGANRTAQLAPALDSEERLVVADLEMLDAIAAVCPDLNETPPSRHLVRRTLVWGSAAVASILLIIFVLIPAVSVELARQIPPERAEALGDAIVAELPAMVGVQREGAPPPRFCIAREGRAALARMTARLTPHATIPFDLKVQVLDHGLINAFAVPGGRVVLFRGLIDAARTPEEVAGVLAHEIGHVIHRDPSRGVLRAAGTSGMIGLLMGDVLGAGMITAASEAALNAGYQRDAEVRADEAAYTMLSGAGLPTVPFSQFFGRLGARSGGEGGIMRYLASHPGLEGRAVRARAADTVGSAPYRPVLSDRDWLALRRICSRTAPLR